MEQSAEVVELGRASRWATSFDKLLSDKAGIATFMVRRSIVNKWIDRHNSLKLANLFLFFHIKPVIFQIS